MKKTCTLIMILAIVNTFFFTGCQKSREPDVSVKKTIVVTYSVLASVVKELAGDYFTIITVIPNGLDLHEWEPSAKDIEAITKAKLIVRNGLGLEGGMEKALRQAQDEGVSFFTASDHITIRKVGKGEGIPSDDPDQAAGADDPHLWMDPITVKTVIRALADYLRTTFSVDLSKQVMSLSTKLDELDALIKKEVGQISPENRKLVTGHESLGYFAQAYGFMLVGAVIPSLTTQAEESASDMAAIKKLIAENHVRVIFTELGTPPKVADALAKEAGAKTVRISTQVLPSDMSYFTFMENLARTITESLR